MFIPERWADAFVNVLDEGTEAGLEILMALAPIVKTIPGKVSGLLAARRLEAMIRSAGKKTGFEHEWSFEMSCRFVSLVVLHGHLAELDRLIEAVGVCIDRRQGILQGLLEYAVKPEDSFMREFEEALKRKTGAKGIRLEGRLEPELLGGYRLKAAGFLIDASLSGALKRMKRDLGEHS
ncbi:MAG: F0F1 ATP synthase subunit delta [Treponema sp.]|jgi:F0F1-type ATP synthase delta subunit|nr:F0F1 ATP synthase subunit delta [Treponema sp.]